jgi:hypothetical protein
VAGTFGGATFDLGHLVMGLLVCVPSSVIGKILLMPIQKSFAFFKKLRIHAKFMFYLLTS